jgi:hypothetical protein
LSKALVRLVFRSVVGEDTVIETQELGIAVSFELQLPAPLEGEWANHSLTAQVTWG